MGDILTFPAVERRRLTPAPPREGGAQIIFFPGVRYERTEPKPRKQKAARRSAPGGASPGKPRGKRNSA